MAIWGWVLIGLALASNAAMYWLCRQIYEAGQNTARYADEMEAKLRQAESALASDCETRDVNKG